MNVAATPSQGKTRTRLLRDFLRLYRVADWVHFLPLPLAGWLATPGRDPLALVGGIAGWALALGYTSAINQAFDARVDWSNPQKNPVGKSFGRREAVLLSLPPALAALGVVFACAPEGLYAVGGLLLAATLYSAPPRLKCVPLVGTLWNVVVGAPGLFFAGGLTALTEPPLRLFLGLFSLLLVVSQLVHEGEDEGDDRQGGVPTLATHLGRRGVLVLAMGLLVLLPLAAWFLAAGLESRILITASNCVFSAIFLVACARHLRPAAPVFSLRPLRLGYRYASLVLGALVFTAALR